MEYRIDTPKNVNFIIKLLEREGFEAFAVGGCVRDALMEREPQDWDITTSAAPLDVKKIFHRTIDTGLQHGTVTVMLEKEGYEVTTYRIDGSYSDGRHPDQVLFTKNLVEDLKRRDFTINAMAYNDRVGIVDEFDGIGDLNRKVIKCVGNPVERFTEDALRMLRAVRFAAKLGFTIEENTAEAIRNMAPNIKKVSKERIQNELNKLVTSDNPHILININDLGMDKYILDDSVLVQDEESSLTKWEIAKKYENIVKVMKATTNDHYLRWAAFMMYEGIECKKVLKGLKFDNKTINICSKLVENVGYFENFNSVDEKKYHIKKLLVDIGTEIFEEYYIPFIKAAVAADILDSLDVEGIDNEVLTEIESLYKEIIVNGDCFAKEKLALKGTDLLELGVESGKIMGEVINQMFEAVLRNPEMNDRTKLKRLIGK